MSSMNPTPNEFAYGSNNYDGCACPAVATGRNPISHHMEEDDYPGLLDVTEHYDMILENRVGEFQGVVDDEVARDAWREAIESAIDRGLRGRFTAVEIAVELGWAEEGDYDL